MTTRITLGQEVEDSFAITVDGAPTDPASLTFRYRLFRDATSEVIVSVPDPQSPPAPIVRNGPGDFSAVVELDQIGDWRLRWESESPAAASEATVIVRSDYPSS